ncbi:MAG TPA: ZIP family metal transporter [Candidatus Omnitrophota bacterium]|nr:ZIP family metal transporter [Candidatus Omnitrophota bacterium]HPB69154.1 ZIP family metal transporter [Candidatus Omnitrophota bacterium]HQO58631.1 ZIP family metal transporter [Candidatus Omnitrophota bacterium]HQP11595.1 ZIP family metal transporter [Candidatus Omnitrophota bacterium]
MIEFLSQLHPVVQALWVGLFTWGMTALGAAAVFLTKEVNRTVLDAMLGFAAGVMIAASYWSLLSPALEMSQDMGVWRWFPAASGFLLGGAFLRGVDYFMPHLHLGLPIDKAEGIKTSFRRTTLLILAVTLHNIPEGLAVGVAIGAAAAGLPSATLPAALALAFGIGIQNMPEGLAISAPLRREGLTVRKSFLYGQISGIVELFASILGAAVVLWIRPVLPYALAFAAGAMIYVVVEEVIPESQQGENTDISTMGVMLGFVIMMILDVALG